MQSTPPKTNKKTSKKSPLKKKKESPSLNEPAQHPHYLNDEIPPEIAQIFAEVQEEFQKDQHLFRRMIFHPLRRNDQWSQFHAMWIIQSGKYYRYGQNQPIFVKIMYRFLLKMMIQARRYEQSRLALQKTEMQKQEVRQQEKVEQLIEGEVEEEYCIIPATDYDQLNADIIKYQKFIKQYGYEEKYARFVERENLQCEADSEELLKPKLKEKGGKKKREETSKKKQSKKQVKKQEQSQSFMKKDVLQGQISRPSKLKRTIKSENNKNKMMMITKRQLQDLIRQQPHITTQFYEQYRLLKQSKSLYQRHQIQSSKKEVEKKSEIKVQAEKKKESKLRPKSLRKNAHK